MPSRIFPIFPINVSFCFALEFRILVRVRRAAVVAVLSIIFFGSDIFLHYAQFPVLVLLRYHFPLLWSQGPMQCFSYRFFQIFFSVCSIHFSISTHFCFRSLSLSFFLPLSDVIHSKSISSVLFLENRSFSCKSVNFPQRFYLLLIPVHTRALLFDLFVSLWVLLVV